MDSKQHWQDKWTWREPGIGFLDVEKEGIYDPQYFYRYVNLEGTLNGDHINQMRRDMVNGIKYQWPCPITRPCLLDVGIGSGSFLSFMVDSFDVRGMDVNPLGIDWLKRHGMWCENIFEVEWDVVTFWDSMEHISNAHTFIQELKTNAICVSLPVFRDESAVFISKHFKPGEHLHYFTVEGFVDWMADLGFALWSFNRDEGLVGREGIGSFSFRKHEAV